MGKGIAGMVSWQLSVGSWQLAVGPVSPASCPLTPASCPLSPVPLFLSVCVLVQIVGAHAKALRRKGEDVARIWGARR
jgi:hypothetical protein